MIAWGRADLAPSEAFLRLSYRYGTVRSRWDKYLEQKDKMSGARRRDAREFEFEF